MREGDRVMLVEDFHREACYTIPAGTLGLLGTCEGNLCHVLFSGAGPAIVPMDLLEKHAAEPETNALEFEEDVSTILDVIDHGEALEVHLVVSLVPLKKRLWSDPKPVRTYTLQSLRSMMVTFSPTLPKKDKTNV
jgi:hypothetical protein